MIKAALLRKVFLFQGLSELEIEALAEAATIHRLPRKTRVIIAEAEGYTFFVISKGKVKVSLSGTDGREVILTTLGPGNFFGDMSLLDGNRSRLPAANLNLNLAPHGFRKELIESDFHHYVKQEGGYS